MRGSSPTDPTPDLASAPIPFPPQSLPLSLTKPQRSNQTAIVHFDPTPGAPRPRTTASPDHKHSTCARPTAIMPSSLFERVSPLSTRQPWVPLGVAVSMRKRRFKRKKLKSKPPPPPPPKVSVAMDWFEIPFIKKLQKTVRPPTARTRRKQIQVQALLPRESTFGYPPERPGTSEFCHAGFRLPAAAVAGILRSTASGASRCYMTRPSCIAPHIPSLLLRRWCSLGRRAP